MSENGTMTYRTMKKSGDSLSILGYGCMRFPRKNGAIDEARTEKQVISAIEQGVNYFDTAYLYPGSEAVLGKILAKGYRDKVKIATKLPTMYIKEKSDINNIFQTELNRLQTDYIDYYLMHNISNFEDWGRLKTIGVLDFIAEEKKSGRIRNIGFSFHGNINTFKEMVDDYDWDFCQIQYNYLDEHYQAGKEGLHYAANKGLGVIVMEPLRGGTLGAKLPAEAIKLLDQGQAHGTPASWALKWLWSQPEVTVVLSGMNEESHIQDNIKTAAAMGDHPELSAAEVDRINAIRGFFQSRMKVNCTACAYCMPCPYGVDIPTCFANYNNRSIFGGINPIVHYVMATEGVINGKPSKASKCKNCGACEAKCPQHIQIRHHLKNTAAEMEKAYIQIPMRIGLKLMNRGKKKATS